MEPSNDYWKSQDAHDYGEDVNCQEFVVYAEEVGYTAYDCQYKNYPKEAIPIFRTTRTA
jgi:hypothetical protein